MSDPGQETERALVDQCLAGNPEAWEAFLDRYLPLLTAAVRRTLRRYHAPEDPATIQDLLQETCLSLIKDDASALRTFGWEYPLRNHLIAIAVHRTVDFLRRRHPAISLEDPVVEEASWRELIPSAVLSPSDVSSADELRSRILQAVSRLPRREQTLLRLFYWEGIPSEGIGRILGLQGGTVRSLLIQARERLRKLLDRPFLLF